MILYSEHFNDKKKATISLDKKGWHSQFDRYVVEMFIDNRIVQKVSVKTEQEADIIAENFVNGESQGGPELLID
jgi:hypothetical protein